MANNFPPYGYIALIVLYRGQLVEKGVIFKNH